MQRVNVEPRTQRWFDVRNESMTASMAAVFFVPDNLRLLAEVARTKGVSLDVAPLLDVGIESFFGNTLWTLWADKMGMIPRFRGNSDTERGTRNEEKVVRAFEASQAILAEREVTATCDDKESWILASFDALVPASSDPSVFAPNGFPVEAKCPAFPSRKKLWDSKKAGQLAVMGLPYYWCQVQHQILVADAPYGWFVAAGVEADPENGEETVVYPIVEKVMRDDPVLTAYKAVLSFYYENFLYPAIEPPKLPSDEKLLEGLTQKAEFDRAVGEGEVDVAVDLYLDVLNQEKELAAQRKALESKVIAAAERLRSSEEAPAGLASVVKLADRLEISFSSASSVSWQKAAKALAKEHGLKEVPAAIIEACTSAPRQVVKIKEMVA